MWQAMYKSIQLLLVLSLLAPVIGEASEETLEERKKRIMRKYLRVRSEMVQSDLYVPEEADEEVDVDIADTDHLQSAKIAIERHEPGMSPMPMPVPRRAVRQKKDTSWMIEEEPEAKEERPKKSAELERWNNWEFEEERPRSMNRWEQTETTINLMDQTPNTLRGQASLLNPNAPETTEPRRDPYSSYPSTMKRNPGTALQQQNPLYSPNRNPSSRTTSQPPGLFRPQNGGQSEFGGELNSYGSSRRRSEAENRTFGSNVGRDRRNGPHSMGTPYSPGRTTFGQPANPYNQQEQTEYRRSSPMQKWNERGNRNSSRNNAYIDELLKGDRR